MGTIISSGIGSGLDVAGLVQRLVAAEGQPKSVRLDLEEANAQARLSALSTVRSALSEFDSALETLSDLENFRGRAVAQRSTDYFTAMASSAAEPGSYRIEVERLASAHRLRSAVFANQDAVVGTGTLTLSKGAEAFAVAITAENNTLAGIAAAVNGATTNPGITATVVNGVDGAYLVLSSLDTGASNNLVVTQTGGDGGLAGLVYDPIGGTMNLTELSQALDSRILIDSIAVESPTNSVSGAIAGLDIELVATNQVGETTEIGIDYDRSAARATIEKLVESYNRLVDAVKSVSSYDAKTSTAGPLFGDAGLRNIVFQLRRELTSEVAGLDGTLDTLSEIGIEVELDGKLAIDSTRLDAAFEADFDAVGLLFSEANDGIAVRLQSLLEPYLQSGGILDSRNESANAVIERISERRESLAQRLEALEQRLFKQFNALDTLLAQMQGTSEYLTQQLASLPGFASTRK